MLTTTGVMGFNLLHSYKLNFPLYNQLSFDTNKNLCSINLKQNVLNLMLNNSPCLYLILGYYGVMLRTSTGSLWYFSISLTKKAVKY